MEALLILANILLAITIPVVFWKLRSSSRDETSMSGYANPSRYDDDPDHGRRPDG